MVGVAAASTSASEVLVAGIAGLVAGAMSMAAGEYVSVSSQADTENADLARERRELAEQPEAELDELTQIYVDRGVEPALARQIAQQMTAKDAFATHARDELGLSEHVVARPIQAALTSSVTFAVGAALPLLIAIVAPVRWTAPAVSGGSLVGLAVLVPSGPGPAERPCSSRPCGSRSGARSRWRRPLSSARSSGVRSSVRPGLPGGRLLSTLFRLGSLIWGPSASGQNTT